MDVDPTTPPVSSSDVTALLGSSDALRHGLQPIRDKFATDLVPLHRLHAMLKVLRHDAPVETKLMFLQFSAKILHADNCEGPDSAFLLTQIPMVLRSLPPNTPLDAMCDRFCMILASLSTNKMAHNMSKLSRVFIALASLGEVASTFQFLKQARDVDPVFGHGLYWSVFVGILPLVQHSNSLPQDISSFLDDADMFRSKVFQAEMQPSKNVLHCGQQFIEDGFAVARVLGQLSRRTETEHDFKQMMQLQEKVLDRMTQLALDAVKAHYQARDMHGIELILQVILGIQEALPSKFFAAESRLRNLLKMLQFLLGIPALRDAIFQVLVELAMALPTAKPSMPKDLLHDIARTQVMCYREVLMTAFHSTDFGLDDYGEFGMEACLDETDLACDADLLSVVERGLVNGIRKETGPDHKHCSALRQSLHEFLQSKDLRQNANSSHQDAATSGFLDALLRLHAMTVFLTGTLGHEGLPDSQTMKGLAKDVLLAVSQGIQNPATQSPWCLYQCYRCMFCLDDLLPIVPLLGNEMGAFVSRMQAILMARDPEADFLLCNMGCLFLTSILFEKRDTLSEAALAQPPPTASLEKFLQMMPGIYQVPVPQGGLPPAEILHSHVLFLRKAFLRQLQQAIDMLAFKAMFVTVKTLYTLGMAFPAITMKDPAIPRMLSTVVEDAPKSTPSFIVSTARGFLWVFDMQFRPAIFQDHIRKFCNDFHQFAGLITMHGSLLQAEANSPLSFDDVEAVLDLLFFLCPFDAFESIAPTFLKILEFLGKHTKTMILIDITGELKEEASSEGICVPDAASANGMQAPDVQDSVVSSMLERGTCDKDIAYVQSSEFDSMSSKSTLNAEGFAFSRLVELLNVLAEKGRYKDSYSAVFEKSLACFQDLIQTPEMRLADELDPSSNQTQYRIGMPCAKAFLNINRLTGLFQALTMKACANFTAIAEFLIEYILREIQSTMEVFETQTTHNFFQMPEYFHHLVKILQHMSKEYDSGLRIPPGLASTLTSMLANVLRATVNAKNYKIAIAEHTFLPGEQLASNAALLMKFLAPQHEVLERDVFPSFLTLLQDIQSPLCVSAFFAALGSIYDWTATGKPVRTPANKAMFGKMAMLLMQWPYSTMTAIAFQTLFQDAIYQDTVATMAQDQLGVILERMIDALLNPAQPNKEQTVLAWFLLLRASNYRFHRPSLPVAKALFAELPDCFLLGMEPAFSTSALHAFMGWFRSASPELTGWDHCPKQLHEAFCTMLTSPDFHGLLDQDTKENLTRISQNIEASLPKN